MDRGTLGAKKRALMRCYFADENMSALTKWVQGVIPAKVSAARIEFLVFLLERQAGLGDGANAPP